MHLLNYDTRRLFLFAIQVFFGIWLLYVGLVKWIQIGSGPFITAITTDFDKTWSPHWLNVFLAWIILIAEPILALAILSGEMKRVVWSLTAIFLFMLVMGQTMLMKADVIGNWEYLVLAVVCAAFSEPFSTRDA